MEFFTQSQLKTLSGFFSNMAVLWFGAAFIGSRDILVAAQYALSGIMALSVSMFMVKEIK